MTPEQIEQERTAFEAWVKGSKEGGLPVSLRKDKEKSYFNPLAEVSFMAWLARAEQTGWISVEDRLPETEGYVIVAWANGYVELSRCTRDKYSHGGSWHPDFIPDDITHWQPLPKPPAGGAK